MKKIKLLGIPFEFGQDHSGVALAASHLRKNGLLKRLASFTEVDDLGDIKFTEKKKDYIRDGVKFLDEVSQANLLISDKISNLDLQDSFLLNIGGDHGMALGSVHGVLEHHPDSVVIWADAHGDINTPSCSPSGNFHGMPVAYLMKIAKQPEFAWIRNRLLPEKLILIGPRDLDEGEVELIQRYNIQYFSSDDVNRIGSKEILEMALHRADPQGVYPIHLSFDVDFCDELDVSSTGTRVANGPHLEEVFLLGGLLAETGRLKSMDVVEFNPLIGNDKEVRASGDLTLDFIEATMKHVFSQNDISLHYLENVSHSQFA
ncbi:MAG: arginase [Bacteriovoracia bacterium]